MLKNKSIFSVLFMVYTLFSVVNVSCNKDNPIIPNPQNQEVIDSGFFNWDFDTINVSTGLNIYIVDTNKIVIPGSPYSIYYNNGSTQYIDHNDPDFIAYCVNGTDINNIYIGGSGNTWPYGKSKLKRWNGIVIEDIELPNDSSQRLLRIVPISRNEIWMSADKNHIYCYKNGLIASYKLDSGLINGVIFKDNFGNLFSKFEKHFFSLYDYLFYIFKFENNSWIQIWKDSVSSNTEMQHFIGFMDNKLLRSGRTGIYYFSGNNWIKFMNFSTDIIPHVGGGGSPNNIIFKGVEEGVGISVFYYNENQIYRQPYYDFPDGFIAHIQYKYNRYYLLIYDHPPQDYFGIGKFKHQNFLNLKTNQNEKNIFNNNSNIIAQ